MKIKFLEPNEYHKLDGIDGAGFTPDNSLVAVAVDDDDKVIGRMAIVQLPHLEGSWVAPAHRGSTVGARLEKTCVNKLKELGAATVIGFAPDDTLELYLKRLGYTKFATAWKKEI